MCHYVASVTQLWAIISGLVRLGESQLIVCKDRGWMEEIQSELGTRIQWAQIRGRHETILLAASREGSRIG